MPSRKSRKDRRPDDRRPHGRRNPRGQSILAAILTLSVIAAGAAAARLKSTPGGEPAVSTPAPVHSQSGPFSPSKPAKEYVYVGGRLVAVEGPGKVDQVITFGQPPDRTYGDAPFQLSATSSSGLPVNFTIVAGPTTVSGATVTITGAGPVTVRADQAGDAGHNPAPGVTHTFTVAKATPVITWGNPADIAHGTALGPTQLNASASAAGAFAYAPAAGTVLSVGNNQMLSVSFTPADGANYNTAAASAYINVVGCPAAGSSSFTATSPVGAGSASALTWNVPYATGVTIAGVSGAFGAAGSTLVWPAATTTYTLTATAAGVCSPPTITRQATVVVQPCPTAGQTTFTADSYLVPPGAGVQLSWSAPHATGIIIQGTTACAPTQICWTPVYSGNAASGSVGVSPMTTTTYMISAENGVNGCSQIQKQLTVETSNAACSPGAYFHPGQLPPGDYFEGTAMLEWSVPNATSLTITDNTGGDYGTYGPAGQIYISSRFATRTYTLRAQIAGSAACSPFVLVTTVECSIDCSGSSMY